MDLIEKLGGYEKAKGVFSRMSVCQRGCIEDKLVFFSFAGLQKALLEYRREHNIYEVGDKVVSAISRDSNNQVFEITAVNPNFMESGEFQLSYGFFKHATDEEIKAGRREVG